MKYYCTEFIGTFFLTLTVALAADSQLAPLAIGAVLMVMVYAGGYISGGHYNPAVSIAVALSRAFNTGKLKFYILSQILAATFASLVAQGLTGKTFAPAPVGSLLFAPLIAEIIFTMALCLVVLHTAVSQKTKGNSYYGLAIGFTLLVAAIAAGPISGAVLNPAIGIGAFLAQFISGVSLTPAATLLYIVGPVTGAFLAASVYGIQKS